MLNPARFDEFCLEFSFVEKSIEVTLRRSEQTFRLDALYSPRSTTPYTVRAYIQEQISFPTEDEPHGSRLVWTAHHLPAILTARSADEALVEALSWLRDR